MPNTRTTVTLADDVFRAVKVRAARTGKRDSQVIEEAIRRDLGLDRLAEIWARVTPAPEAELVVSPLLLDELERVPRRKKFRRYADLKAVAAYLDSSRQDATVAPDPAEPPPIRCADPDDDYLIALAHDRGAALVSGDRQLLGNVNAVVRNAGWNSEVERRLLIGLTNGGRVLTLVIEQTLEPTDWLVITGWAAAPHERRMLGG